MFGGDSAVASDGVCVATGDGVEGASTTTGIRFDDVIFAMNER
jgi:hypothetical protein